MSINNDEKMKSIVEKLVSTLSKQGIKVENAAIMNFGKIEDPKKEAAIDKTIKEVLDNMSELDSFLNKSVKPTTKNGFEEFLSLGKKLENTENSNNNQCYCSDCFNFSTFEQILSKKGGSFDYASVKLGGKTFDLKYWSNGPDENIMIAPQKPVFTPTGTLDELQIQLNQAVQEKAYDKAQVLITLINDIKKEGN